MAHRPFTLATRQSPLALWQAECVKKELERHHPGLKVALLGLTTTADRTEGPLHATGGKGLFVKELEDALLSGHADIAVHSMKDVPVTLPTGLTLPVMCSRENPLDALLTNESLALDHYPEGARIGTGSPRRECQLLTAYPHLRVAPLRGNIQTRIKKLQQGEYTAIILAMAGLIRMNLTEHIRHIFPSDILLPAAGQGALGIECRMDDANTARLIAPLHHAATADAVMAERAVCRALGASCHTPVAAFAEIDNSTLTLRARVGQLDGKILLHTQVTGHSKDAEALGMAAAADLLNQGARALLERQP